MKEIGWLENSMAMASVHMPQETGMRESGRTTRSVEGERLSGPTVIAIQVHSSTSHLNLNREE